jgi:hypothetical protein
MMNQQQQQQPQQPHQHQQHQRGHPQHANTPQSGEQVPGFNPMTQQLVDPYDPMLDMDPFGLSASMHFPTQFTFDTSSMR